MLWPAWRRNAVAGAGAGYGQTSVSWKAAPVQLPTRALISRVKVPAFEDVLLRTKPPGATVWLEVLPSGAVTVAMYDVALLTAAKLVMLAVAPRGPLLQVPEPVAVAGAGIEYVPTAIDEPVFAVKVA
ncbi:hypothetical protein BJG92_01448 [Arthrobacter sp. SO5]|nr:hypothetical protein [Arthrobacter sp. SO5]